MTFADQLRQSLASSAYDGAKKRQYLMVLRHGLREDEVDGHWVDIADRPWDPPLAEQGLEDVSLYMPPVAFCRELCARLVTSLH